MNDLALAWRLMAEEDYADYVVETMVRELETMDEREESARERAEIRNKVAYDNDELDLY